MKIFYTKKRKDEYKEVIMENGRLMLALQELNRTNISLRHEMTELKVTLALIRQILVEE